MTEREGGGGCAPASVTVSKLQLCASDTIEKGLESPGSSSALPSITLRLGSQNVSPLRLGMPNRAPPMPDLLTLEDVLKRLNGCAGSTKIRRILQGMRPVGATRRRSLLTEVQYQHLLEALACPLNLSDARPVTFTTSEALYVDKAYSKALALATKGQLKPCGSTSKGKF
jgi:hypothetical protein